MLEIKQLHAIFRSNLKKGATFPQASHHLPGQPPLPSPQEVILPKLEARRQPRVN